MRHGLNPGEYCRTPQSAQFIDALNGAQGAVTIDDKKFKRRSHVGGGRLPAGNTRRQARLGAFDANGYEKTAGPKGTRQFKTQRGKVVKPYFLAMGDVLRRNLVVNFSTRPAVSTMRFSPV